MKNFVWGKQGTTTYGSLFHKQVPLAFKLTNVGDEKSPSFIYIVYTEPMLSFYELNSYIRAQHVANYTILPFSKPSKRKAMDELRNWVNNNYNGLQRLVIEKFRGGAKF